MYTNQAVKKIRRPVSLSITERALRRFGVSAVAHSSPALALRFSSTNRSASLQVNTACSQSSTMNNF